MTVDAVPLDQLQRWMQGALVFPAQVAGERIDTLLRSSPGLSGAAGLAIYQRGYFLRIAACMREQFPALCHALGEALFDDFVADYIHVNPPESYTLYDLGRRFAGYLDASRPDRDLAPAARESWIDFMIDLARFERQVFTLFDAPGHEGKAFADETTPDDALRLQPCCALGGYRFPVAAYYHAVRQKQAPPQPDAAPHFVAMVRTDYVTRTVPLKAAEHCFLAAMADGGRVDAAIDAVAHHLAIAAEAVRETWAAPQGARARWISWGFFIPAA
ncbi:DNA-binding domain-containing protein [Sphingomonas sp. AR_OL41]|uniref:HvfC/BufC N-terminal domain-containing protein n=1 Tax=Sphingomonas sp. AR_OL41 TaxID=3042729 RepID=UPI002480C296|nr:DNA-binding domain-containing protein [Sphingomonas sp. AR_OL41]MDH7971486.1 DNA-binding domain-containing protein [Sphingomonas sp. AR_OL41]